MTDKGTFSLPPKPTEPRKPGTVVNLDLDLDRDKKQDHGTSFLASTACPVRSSPRNREGDGNQPGLRRCLNRNDSHRSIDVALFPPTLNSAVGLLHFVGFVTRVCSQQVHVHSVRPFFDFHLFHLRPCIGPV